MRGWQVSQDPRQPLGHLGGLRAGLPRGRQGNAGWRWREHHRRQWLLPIRAMPEASSRVVTSLQKCQVQPGDGVATRALVSVVAGHQRQSNSARGRMAKLIEETGSDGRPSAAVVAPPRKPKRRHRALRIRQSLSGPAAPEVAGQRFHAGVFLPAAMSGGHAEGLR